MNLSTIDEKIRQLNELAEWFDNPSESPITFLLVNLPNSAVKPSVMLRCIADKLKQNVKYGKN